MLVSSDYLIIYIKLGRDSIQRETINHSNHDQRNGKHDEEYEHMILSEFEWFYQIMVV